MKFGAQWKQRVAELPASLQDAAISYKAWKKRVKREPPAPDVFLGTLKDECERVNRRFLESVGAARDAGGAAWWRAGACACGSEVAPSAGPGEAYAFAVLNRTCVYKLCKKYDKALRRRSSLDEPAAAAAPAPAASPWFRRALGAGAYAFLNSVELKRLELDLGGAAEACPACLEDTPSAEAPAAYILVCGHVMCVACVQDLYGVRRLRGTLYNKLAYGRYRSPGARCPMCRAPDPLGALSARHIYPADRAAMLSELSGFREK